MTRFEWFESGAGIEAIKLELIEPEVFTKYIRYKVYHDLLMEGQSVEDATTIASERIGCSPTTIWRDRQFFEMSTYRRISIRKVDCRKYRGVGHRRVL